MNGRPRDRERARAFLLILFTLTTLFFVHFLLVPPNGVRIVLYFLQTFLRIFLLPVPNLEQLLTPNVVVYFLQTLTLVVLDLDLFLDFDLDLDLHFDRDLDLDLHGLHLRGADLHLFLLVRFLHTFLQVLRFLLTEVNLHLL